MCNNPVLKGEHRLESRAGAALTQESAVSSWERGPDTDSRAALIRRVLGSSTFEHSPKLRAFLEYVCQCALDNEPAAATEPQIGIHVFGRAPGYNANEDNIVRSQARLLRLKLEHHFAHEGRNEPVVITIPKGRYLPTFEPRQEDILRVREKSFTGREEGRAEAEKSGAGSQTPSGQQNESGSPQIRWPLYAAVVILLAGGLGWIAHVSFRPHAAVAADTAMDETAANDGTESAPAPVAVAASPSDKSIRIAAGNTVTLVDPAGHRWNSDEYFEGGVSEAGPAQIFPPVSDPSLFRNVREGLARAGHAPGGFQYDIPVPAGVYELRLYFADPIRYSVPGSDGQHLRHFQVALNGKPILTDFDAIADAGPGAVDVRTFRDIAPAEDGEVHLNFAPSQDRPFVSALELTPGLPGQLKPIRFSVHDTDLVDENGTRWAGDEYFINGSKVGFSPGQTLPNVSPLYSEERYGNFAYAIPVPPGSYTVRLHFMESFWGPSVGMCQGVGCRVFDVTCNGATLLQDFDIFQSAGGEFRPIVKTFRGLHPNGQGKLMISFSPKVDYAEVRAIEVIDEGSGEQKKP